MLFRSFADASIGSNWLEIFRSGADPQIATPGNLTIVTDSTSTAPTWTFDDTGNLTFPDATVQTTAGWTGHQLENIYIGLQSNIGGNQGTRAVAIGALAGGFGQGNSATAVGDSSGFISQGAESVAVDRKSTRLNSSH